MIMPMDIAGFTAYLVGDFDLGFAVLPNMIVAAIAAIVIGSLIRQSWLSYSGVFAIFAYYLVARFIDVI
jgi:hypothetical protein